MNARWHCCYLRCHVDTSAARRWPACCMQHRCMSRRLCWCVDRSEAGREELAGECGSDRAQSSAKQCNEAQHSTAQHSTAQHSTAQHSTAQHSTASTGLLVSERPLGFLPAGTGSAHGRTRARWRANVESEGGTSSRNDSTIRSDASPAGGIDQGTANSWQPIVLNAASQHRNGKSRRS
jgi:hypothetical protein